MKVILANLEVIQYNLVQEKTVLHRILFHHELRCYVIWKKMNDFLFSVCDCFYPFTSLNQYAFTVYLFTMFSGGAEEKGLRSKALIDSLLRLTFYWFFNVYD